MKRNWKRILSLWLTVCMVFTMNFGLGAVGVYAGNDTDLNTDTGWTYDSDDAEKIGYENETAIVKDDITLKAGSGAKNLAVTTDDADDHTLTLTGDSSASEGAEPTVTITGKNKLLTVVNNAAKVNTAAADGTVRVVSDNNNEYYVDEDAVESNTGVEIEPVLETFDEGNEGITFEVTNLSTNKAKIIVFTEAEDNPDGSETENVKNGSVNVKVSGYEKGTEYTAKLILDATDAGLQAVEAEGKIYKGTTANETIKKSIEFTAGSLTAIAGDVEGFDSVKYGDKEATYSDASYIAEDKKLEIKAGKTENNWVLNADASPAYISLNSADEGANVTIKAKSSDGVVYVSKSDNVTVDSDENTALAAYNENTILAEYAAGKDNKYEAELDGTTPVEKTSSSIKFNLKEALKVDAIAVLKDGEGNEAGRKPLEAGSIEFTGLDEGTAYTLTLELPGHEGFDGIVGTDGHIYTGIDWKTGTTDNTATTSANTISEGISQEISANGNVLITYTGEKYGVTYVISANDTDEPDAGTAVKSDTIAAWNGEDGTKVTKVTEIECGNEEQKYYIYYKYDGVDSDWSDPVELTIPALKTISANWSTSSDISNLTLTYGNDKEIREALQKAAVAEIVGTKTTDAEAAAETKVYVKKLTAYTDDAGVDEEVTDTTTFDAGKYVAIVKTNYTPEKAKARGFNVTPASVSKNFTVKPGKLTLTLKPTSRIIAVGSSVDKGDWKVGVKEDATLTVDNYLLLSGNTAESAITDDTVFAKADKYTISISADGAEKVTIKKNGEGKNLAGNYDIDMSATVTLDVVDMGENSYLEVRSNKYSDKLYWDDLDSLTDEALEDYVDVYLINGDEERKISAQDFELEVASGNSAALYGNLASLNSKYKEVGASFYVSANSTVLSVGSKLDSTLQLTVQKQPLVISANGAAELTQLAGETPDDKYTGTIQVFKLNKDGKLADDITTRQGVNLINWTTSFNATIDLTDIDTTRAGKYDIDLKDITLVSANDISKHFTVDSAYGVYVVQPSLIISLVDLETGEALSANKPAPVGNTNVEFVSTNKAEKTTGVSWYLRYYNTYSGEELESPVPKGFNVGPNSNGYGVIIQRKSGDALTLSGNLTLYGRFGSDKTEATSSKDSNFYVTSINPVVYNGNKFVWYDDDKFENKKTGAVKKGYQQGLYFEVFYGNSGELKYGTDYKLSYKNNTNAATASAGKKAPTVVITGVGNYKGLKIEQTFTILPADFANLAEISLKNEFVKYTGKAMNKIVKGNAVYLVGSKKGKSLPSKGYSFKIYNAAGKDVTNTVMAKTAAYGEYSVKAVASGKDANYTGETNEVAMYGIPSNAKAIKVAGIKKKENYSASGKTKKDFIDTAKFSATVGKKLKITSVSDQRIEVDLVRKATWEADPVEKLTDAGTYYMRVKPLSANTFAAENVFEPAYVKISYKGQKVNNIITLTKKQFTWNGKAHDLELKISNKATATDDIKIYNTNTGVSGVVQKVEPAIGSLKDFSSGTIPGDKLGNSGAGTYTLIVEGTGAYEGSYSLTYTVGAPKYNSKMVQAYINTESKQEDMEVSYNKAGYADSLVKVYWTDPTNSSAQPVKINLDNDYTVEWGKNDSAGKQTVTIKGTNTYFSGSFKKTFTVNKADINQAVYERKYSSALLSSNKANVYLYQTNTDGDTGVLVQGKDFKVTNIKESTNGKTATATIDATSSKCYSGTFKNTITYDLYPAEVTKVVLTLDKTSVSVNSKSTMKEDELGNSYLSSFAGGGSNVSIKEAQIYLKGQKKAISITDPKKISSTFYIGYVNADNLGYKAQVAVMFKDGQSYPNGTVYYSGTYTIYYVEE